MILSSAFRNQDQRYSRRTFFGLSGGLGALAATAHSFAAPASSRVEIRPAPFLRFPGAINENRHQNGMTDSNSPSHWDGDTLYVFNSWEQPWRSSGPDLYHLGSKPAEVNYDNPELKKLWIWLQATWRDEHGVLYGWHQNEVPDICKHGSGELAGYPVVTRIGALRSTDNGTHWHDLGYVLESPATSVLCDTQNMWYAGGVSDFSVIADPQKNFLYFFFTSYAPAFSEQGICAARLPYSERDQQRGKVAMWNGKSWSEPGVGGHPKPFFPASKDITHKDGQTFWGPTIHWNRYLNEYVMLLNRYRDTTASTEGLYATFNRNLEDLAGWSKPEKFMDREAALHADPQKAGNGWYVQLMGVEKGDTDKLAGHTARLFLDGCSSWEIIFNR